MAAAEGWLCQHCHKYKTWQALKFTGIVWWHAEAWDLQRMG
jgi:hypothetical protein